MKTMAKFYLFFLPLLILGNEVPESLLQSLNKASNDPEKLQALVQLNGHYWEQGNLEKSLYYGEKALDLIDSVDALRENHSVRITVINCYQDLGQYEKAQLLAERGASICETTGDFKNACIFLSQSGFSLWQMNKYAKALEQFTTSVNIQKNNNLNENLSRIFNNMGMIYSSLNLPELALEALFKSLQKAEESGEKTGMTLNSIGVVYHKMNNSDKSLEYYDRSLNVQKTAGDKRGIADVLNNIGVVYQSLGNLTAAEDYYLQSMQLEKELGDPMGICDGLNNLGEIKTEIGDLKSALVYFKDSMKIAEEFEDNWRVADSLRNMAKIQRLKNQTSQAIQLIEDSLHKGLASEAKELLMNIYAEMALIYKDGKDFQKAFAAQEEYIRLKEEINSESAIRSSIEYDVKYQTEKSAKEIEILKINAEFQHMVTLSMGVGIGAGILFFLLLFRNYKLKIRAHKEIQIKNQALSDAQDELERLSRTDALTGLFNRRDMMEKILAEKTRYERSHNKFTIILSDIDNFKKFNDTYGHDCGDLALIKVANALSSSIRKQDSLCRWGGEEFLFLLPETTSQGGVLLAEKLRQKVESEKVNYKGEELTVTMTFGVAEYNREEIEPCIKEADEALYAGKEKGRNCVIVAQKIKAP